MWQTLMHNALLFYSDFSKGKLKCIHEKIQKFLIANKLHVYVLYVKDCTQLTDLKHGLN